MMKNTNQNGCEQLKQWENKARLLLKRCGFNSGKCSQLMVCCCRGQLSLIDRRPGTKCARDTSLVPFTQDSTIDPPCIKWHVAVTEWVCQGGICCQDGICWAFQASIHLCVNLGCGRMNLWSGRQLTRDSIKQKEMGLNKFKIGGKCSNLNKKKVRFAAFSGKRPSGQNKV